MCKCVYYSSIDCIVLMIAFYYCGHQLLLTEYNSMYTTQAIPFVALEFNFMDAEAIKVCKH